MGNTAPSYCINLASTYLLLRPWAIFCGADPKTVINGLKFHFCNSKTDKRKVE